VLKMSCSSIGQHGLRLAPRAAVPKRRNGHVLSDATLTIQRGA
jgi:hypothetical protein